MPEARDRLSRPTDYNDVFQRRYSNRVVLGESDSIVGSFGSPVQRLPSATTTGGWGSALRGRGRLGVTAASVGGRNFNTSASEREDILLGSIRRRRVHGATRTLPNWYPRTPLRDITAIVRATERRRARPGEICSRQIATPAPQQVGDRDSPLRVSAAHLKHYNMSMVTPHPAFKNKKNSASTARVHKMLLDITKQSQKESELITPQKKLLYSIDEVEKAVMEEIQKLNSTPSAKRAEREKKLRTLMSMR